MKNLLLFIFLVAATSIQAQIFVDKVNINNQNVQYLEVWEKYDGESQKYLALADYGQFDDRKNDKEGEMLRLTNEEGVALEFNGEIHILNFLYYNGWEVMQVKTMERYDSYIMVRRDQFSEIQISGSDN